MKPENHRIIKAKFLPPTDTKGSRIVLTESRGGITDRKVLSYSYKIGNVLEQSIEALQSVGINVVGFGETKDDYIIFSNTWAHMGKYINIKQIKVNN